MIILTDNAVQKLKDIAEAESLNHLMVRVGVKGGGCSGFMFDMYFEDVLPTDIDITFEQDGVTIICDPASYQYMEGTTIDYVEDLMISGFKFNNPKISGRCGCGKSVDF